MSRLVAPFPYFGGKSRAVETVWSAFGEVDNYVEPFAGSAAILLGAPEGKRVETINDYDGFIANFWRAVAHDADAVAFHADWPCNENDLFARHSWLVRQREKMTDKLHSDPEWYDAKIAGWWCWGSCNWIGSGWCSGNGPWVHNGETLVNASKLPHLGNSGQGINRKLPHLSAGRGINRQLPHLSAGRGERSAFILNWMLSLQERMRSVRVTCGDWSRVVKDSVTTRHGITGLFLDPPYERGEMDYGNGGMGLGISGAVRAWCADSGDNRKMRIILCGHSGEHDELLSKGWTIRTWKARKGYALTDEAVSNSASETIWCSPHCITEAPEIPDMFAEASA